MNRTTPGEFIANQRPYPSLGLQSTLNSCIITNSCDPGYKGATFVYRTFLGGLFPCRNLTWVLSKIRQTERDPKRTLILKFRFSAESDFDYNIESLTNKIEKGKHNLQNCNI